MKVVIQKCKRANVKVENNVISSINKGLVILVGFTHDDTIEDVNYLTKKIVNLRIFEDENGVMNKSVLDEQGQILCVSQFTLYANTKKGNRPSYIDSMKSESASKLYDLFCEKLNKLIITKKGKFQAQMEVELINEGPTTIIIESKKDK